MQNIDLICIGKMNAKYFAEGVAEYQKRLAAFAAFRIIELPEEKIEEKNASDAVVKKALEKEGKAILSNVRKGAAIVAMCIEGKQISSDELAQFLADRANSGAGDVAFVIGSSHGLSDEVKRYDNPHNYYVDLSQKLYDIKTELLNEKNERYEKN